MDVADEEDIELTSQEHQKYMQRNSFQKPKEVDPSKITSYITKTIKHPPVESGRNVKN